MSDLKQQITPNIHGKRWRIGLISDIHGNVVALQATLATLQKLGIDQFICLGDVATSGPNPNETIAMLSALPCQTVMGNTDAWALNPHEFAYRNEETPIIYEFELWAAQQLNQDDRAYLQSFMPTIHLELGESSVLCYHGSPRSNTENIHATTPNAELDAIFADHTATVVIGGHTHTQLVRRHRDMLVVNPGSVGAPIAFNRGASKAHYPAWAEFGVLEIGESRQGSTLQVELHRTPIDLDALIAEANISARERGMPHLAWYLAHWWQA